MSRSTQTPTFVPALTCLPVCCPPSLIFRPILSKTETHHDHGYELEGQPLLQVIPSYQKQACKTESGDTTGRCAAHGYSCCGDGTLSKGRYLNLEAAIYVHRSLCKP